MADSTTPGLRARLGAEFIGTFWLVFAGCGSVVFTIAAGHDFERIAVALAFGLSVLTGVYAFGHISGAHFNPAVTVGLAAAKRFAWADVPGYVASQVLGSTVAGAVILVIAKGHPGFVAKGNMATNGYGDGGFSLGAVLLAEIVLTAFFVWVVLGATAKRGVTAMAGLAIGLSLTVIHLVAIPIDGTSVNPARSLGVAWFGGSHALSQVWLFIVAPLVGGALAGLSHKFIVGEAD